MRKIITLAVLFITVLAITGCGNSPESVVRQFQQKMVDMDYGAAQELTTGKISVFLGKINAMTSKEDRQRVRSMFEDMGWDLQKMKDSTEVTLAEKSGGTAKVDIKGEGTITVTLTQVDGKWKINDIDFHLRDNVRKAIRDMVMR
jgi:hypothetical protein